MEKSNVIHLSERRKKKEKETEPILIEALPEGIAISPEKAEKISEKEGLAIADEVLEKYGDRKALLQDYLDRERHSPLRPLEEQSDDAAIEKDIASEIATQKSYITYLTTEELLERLARHRKEPEHYYGILILAVAEELKKRFAAKT